MGYMKPTQWYTCNVEILWGLRVNDKKNIDNRLAKVLVKTPNIEGMLKISLDGVVIIYKIIYKIGKRWCHPRCGKNKVQISEGPAC